MIATRIVTSSSDSFSPLSSSSCCDDDNDVLRFHHDKGFRLDVVCRELSLLLLLGGCSMLPSAMGGRITSLDTDRG